MFARLTVSKTIADARRWVEIKKRAQIQIVNNLKHQDRPCHGPIKTSLPEPGPARNLPAIYPENILLFDVLSLKALGLVGEQSKNRLINKTARSGTSVRWGNLQTRRILAQSTLGAKKIF